MRCVLVTGVQTCALPICRIIFDYRNGRDLTARPRGAFVIDAFGYDEEKLKAEAPAIYQHLLLNVKPGRDANRRDSIRQNWWIFGWPRPEIRKALNGLDRFIVTVETMKHRIFQFLPKSIAPDRSEEHTSELQSLMRNSYAVFCLKKKKTKQQKKHSDIIKKTIIISRLISMTQHRK